MSPVLVCGPDVLFYGGAESFFGACAWVGRPSRGYDSQFSACVLNGQIWFFPPPMVGERGSPVGCRSLLIPFLSVGSTASGISSLG